VDESLACIAALLGERNSIDASIAKVIDRPVTAGHLGEWIASRIFDIALEESAANQGFDGRFRTGALRGSTVNIKWYMKRTRLLDITEFPDWTTISSSPGRRRQLGHRAAFPGRGASKPCSCLRRVRSAPGKPPGESDQASPPA
jgi:hypothetical protein